MSKNHDIFSTNDDFPVYTDAERILTNIPKDSEFYKSMKKVFSYIEENCESAEDIWLNIEEIAHNALGKDGKVAEFFLNEPEDNFTYYNMLNNVQTKLVEVNATVMQRLHPYNAIKSLQGTAWVNFIDFTYHIRKKILSHEEDTPIEPSELIVWVQTLSGLTNRVVQNYFNIVGSLSDKKLVEIKRFMDILEITSEFTDKNFNVTKDSDTNKKDNGFDLSGWNPDGQKH